MYKKRILCFIQAIVLMFTLIGVLSSNAYAQNGETVEEIKYNTPDFPMQLSGVVYYVDYTDGNDANDGKSFNNPFKHYPGDSKASGNAKLVTLNPGDKIIFKGGVRYPNKVVCTTSGAAGMPIVYDGNTDGTFGTGRAIVDGADILTGWTRCGSLGEAKGNPLYNDIFYVEVDRTADWKDLTWKEINLAVGDNPLPVAQAPNPTDPVYQEEPKDYYYLNSKLYVDDQKTVLTDSVNLTGTSQDAYNGMTFGFHGGSNLIQYLKVESYDPEAHSLRMGLYSGKLYNETRYALFNSVCLIDKPGEFCVEPTDNPRRVRIYLLPLSGSLGENGEPADVTLSSRSVGIEVYNVSHITLQGFRVRQQGNASNCVGITAQGPSEDVVIRDCDVSLVRNGTGVKTYNVSKVLVEDCYVSHCLGRSKGIVLQSGSNIYCMNNTIVKNTSTGLDYYTCKDGVVSGNTVRDHYGIHANGMAFYKDCENIFVEGNYITGSNSPLTIEAIKNITVYNNILDGNGSGIVLGMWNNKSISNIRILNNALLNSNPDSVWSLGLFNNNVNVSGFVARNNIIDGIYYDASFGSDAVFSHNIYTRIGSKYGIGNFGEGELYEPDLKKIFMDPDNGNYRLCSGSPAINAGKDVGVSKDFDGTPRTNGRVDIGPYESDIVSIPAGSVDITEEAITMNVGDTRTLTATVLPQNATNKDLEWESSNTSVATVSASGMVTAVANGTATVTARVVGTDPVIKDTCAVTVGAVQEQGLTITAPGEVAPSKNFSAIIGFNLPDTILNADLSITYNPDLFEYKGYKKIDGGLDVAGLVENQGTIRLLFGGAGSNGAITKNKPLIELKFKSKNTEGFGVFNITEAKLLDVPGKAISPALASITVRVNNIIPGDVNDDGVVDLSDMHFVSTHFWKDNGSGDWNTVKTADCNKDGHIGIEDLVYVARKILQQ